MSQLHEDLIAIRKRQKLTVQDIYDRTRISTENIELIEDGSLFDSPKNITYVRSFARTYGRALGIDDEHMVQALDYTLKGEYSGYLRDIYIQGLSEEEADANAAEAAESTEADEEPSKPEEKPKESLPEEQRPFSFELDVDKPKKKITPKSSTFGAGRPDPGQEHNKVTPPPPDPDQVNWSDLGRKARQPRKKGPSPQIIGGSVLAIVLLIVLVIFLIRQGVFESGVTDPDLLLEDPVTEQPVDADQLAEPDPVEPDQLDVPETTPPAPSEDRLQADVDAPVPPDETRTMTPATGDTLFVLVYAATGNLEPFRVRSDAFQNRRPYWVEQGRAMRVEFFEEVTFWSNLGRMELIINDRIVTQFAEEGTDDFGPFIRINRSQFDSESALQENTSATFPGGLTRPREILERPVIF